MSCNSRNKGGNAENVFVLFGRGHLFFAEEKMMNTMLYQFHINFSFQAAEIIGAVLIVLALFAAFALPRLLTTKASEQQAKKLQSSAN